MLKEEKAFIDDAQVNIQIKSLRYGNKALTSPSVTTVFNGNKVTLDVPFKKSLKYSFKTIEEDMVFKFAVTGGGDLLGFIYMEIPNKFKTMKKFKLDDWFPVKQVETDEEQQLGLLNFVARIVIDYRAKRKLESKHVFTGKIPQAQIYKDMAKTLKQKIGEINKAVDAYNDEGFKFLGDFEQKLIRKKIELKAYDKNANKRIRHHKRNLHLNKQKDNFYKARGVVVNDSEVKEAKIKPKDLYNFTEPDKYKKCGNCRKILKELTHTRKELIEAMQRLDMLEEGQMTVDNVQLKKSLETLQEELKRDKKEFSIKLRE